MDTSEAGRLGGKASAKTLNKKQRHERAKKAVAAREAKRNKNMHTTKIWLVDEKKAAKRKVRSTPKPQKCICTGCGNEHEVAETV